MLAEPLQPRQMFAADLACTGFNFFGGPLLHSGDYTDATVTIKNLNGVWFLDDAGVFSVNAYLSEDSTITTDDMLIGSTTFSGLGAGQTITRTFDCRISSPGHALPDFDPFRTDNQYYIGVIVDPNNIVSESNEGNNSNRGDGLDRERVYGERHLRSPIGSNPLERDIGQIGTPYTDAIGGTGEWIGGYDIDVVDFSINYGQTVAFDLDGDPSLDAYMRLYDYYGNLVAESDNAAAPGESSSGDPFIQVTWPSGIYACRLVVSNAANRNCDPYSLAGRASGGASGQGNYTITTTLLPDAPTAPDLVDWSDSGRSDSDNITRYSGLTFDVTGQSGKFCQILVNGTVAGTGTTNYNGVYEVTTAPLASRDYNVTARLYDPATGYTGPASAPLHVVIDTTPPAAPTAPNLSASSDTGVSSTDDVTSDNTPTFDGTAEPGSRIDLRLSGVQIGTGTTDASGVYAVTTTAAQPDGVYTYTATATDVAGNLSTAGVMQSPVTIDTVAPTLVTSTGFAFAFDTAPQAVNTTFSEDVGATLGINDLAVIDLATQGTVGVTFAYDTTSRTGTYRVTAGVLPKGNYRAILNGAGVTDAAGNPVAGSPTLDFFFLPADANHDRAVDTLDFNALAANFGKGNRTFSQADFNYDGVVDTLDFNTLAAQFGKTLPPATTAEVVAAAPSSRRAAPGVFSSSSPIDDRPIALLSARDDGTTLPQSPFRDSSAPRESVYISRPLPGSR